MSIKVGTYGKTSLVNAKAVIQHPLADEVSLAIGDGAMCTFPYTVELAFFKNGEWVYEIISEFAAYHTNGVYAYVPLEMFANFLDAWREQ